VEPPVWFVPLRSPTWLVPEAREGSPVLAFTADPWEGAVGDAGRDLRLGLPMYLAEALRFGTNARTVVVRTSTEGADEATATIRSEVAPRGGPAVRLRVFGGSGDELAEIGRDASDDASLGVALATLPHEIAQATSGLGVRPVWSSLYRLPAGSSLTAYVRGQHASTRIGTGAVPGTADSETLAARRADVSAVLEGLGALATSVPEAFPALLFFGAVLAARDVGSPVIGGFRMPVNARCTASTDPLDPVYAMTALLARVFGDRATSERRITELRAAGDGKMRSWLARVEAVT
jgi:hypothetical protein